MSRRHRIGFDPMDLLDEFAKGASFGLGVRLTAGRTFIKTPVSFFSNGKKEHELYDEKI